MAMQLLNFSELMSGERDALSQILSGLVAQPSEVAMPTPPQSQFTPQGLPQSMSGMPQNPEMPMAPMTPDQNFLQQAMPMPEMPMGAGMEPEALPDPGMEAGVMPQFGGADDYGDLLGLLGGSSSTAPQGFSLDMGQGGAVDQSGQPIPQSLAGRAQQIYQGLRERGFDHKLATATLGNLQQESNLDPNAHNPSEDANGIMQWRGDRWARGVSLARQTGRSPYDLDNQLDLIAMERVGPEAENWAKAEKAGSVEEATAAIDRHVERSSGEHTANRVSFARQYDGMFSTEPVAASSQGTPFIGPTGPSAAPMGATPTGGEMADPNAPRQGFMEGLGDFFKGEGGPNDYDYSTMLAILSRGLSGISRGEDYDTSDLLANQQQERLFRVQQYQQAKERQAAASYLEGTGRSDLAGAVAAGGMGLDDALTVDQQDYIREQQGLKELETQEARTAIERAMRGRGYSAEEARTLALNPDLIDNMEDARLAQEEASLANMEAEETRVALINRYGDVPGYEDMVAQLQGGASPTVIAETYNLDTDPLREEQGSDATSSQKDYQFYATQETEAGRTPLSFNDWKNQPTRQEVTNIEGVSPADASTTMTRGSIAIDTIDRALDNTSAWTTGLMSLGGMVPGTKGHTLQQQLGTIKAGIGFQQLRALRDASESGASGLGQLTEKELSKLESLWGSLEASQNGDELRYNLTRVKSEYLKSLRQLKTQADKDGVDLSDYGIDTSFLDTADAPAGATQERKTSSGVRWSF